jgi:thiol-disulfide isomerase/thioredoxin
MKLRLIYIVLLQIFTMLTPMTGTSQELGYGQLFPEIELSLPNDMDAARYLGLENPTRFTLSEIQSDIVLVEFLNVHCPHCQMQAPSYNELFKDIAASETGRGRITMLGIAVGNLPAEVEAFRKNYQVEYPIIVDADFSIWRSVYGEATPFSVYVRQTQPGQPGVVAGTHLGLNTGYKPLLAELIKLADIPPADMVAHAEATTQSGIDIKQLFSAAELEYRVRTAFINTGGGIREFSAIPLRSSRHVYTARMQAGDQQRTLFAELVSRPSVCDICHDVHFIYVFDIQGRIFGFESLQLTKYGNVNWNAKEIATMRSRLLGKSLLQKHKYNPQVDAISSATITSALIFDSLNQGSELLSELKEKGF